MSTISVTPGESSYSRMNACINSLPLKIVSCIPIVGLATTTFFLCYSAYKVWTSYKEKQIKAYEAIELIETFRDHLLASAIRQVANAALIILGITTGGALGIEFSLFSGIVYTGGYLLFNYFVEELTEKFEEKKKSLNKK